MQGFNPPNDSNLPAPASDSEIPAVHETIRRGVNLLDMYLRVRHSSKNTRRARFTHVRAHLEDLKARDLKASTINRKIGRARVLPLAPRRK